MSFNTAIIQRILELCDKNNITPNRLAELSAIPPTTMFNLINGNVTNPSAKNIYKICKVFKISLRDFYNTDLFNNMDFDD